MVKASGEFAYHNLLWTTADYHHFFDQLLLPELDGLLDGDLTEGVHGVLHAICHNSTAVWLHTNLGQGENCISGVWDANRKKSLSEGTVPKRLSRSKLFVDLRSLFLVCIFVANGLLVQWIGIINVVPNSVVFEQSAHILLVKWRIGV